MLWQLNDPKKRNWIIPIPNFSYVHQYAGAVNCIMQLTVLYQYRMPLNCLLDPLRFNSDVSLCGGGAAVLQLSLDEDDVVAVGLIDL